MEETPSPYRWLGYMSIWMLVWLALAEKSISSKSYFFLPLIKAGTINAVLTTDEIN